MAPPNFGYISTRQTNPVRPLLEHILFILLRRQKRQHYCLNMQPLYCPSAFLLASAMAPPINEGRPVPTVPDKKQIPGLPYDLDGDGKPKGDK